MRSLFQSIWSVVRHLLSRSWGLLRLLFLFPETKPFSDVDKSRGPGPKTEADIPVDALRVTLQRPEGLDHIGSGASSIVYLVDEHIVLKGRHTFQPLTSNASSKQRLHFATNSVERYSIMKDECIVYRLLEQHPHPNHAKHIDIDHDEGPYLWKYQTLSDFPKPSQATRILCLGIVHADFRVDNILFFSQHHAIVADFGFCCPIGESNYYFRFPGEPVQINGLAETKSEATDMFAMSSVMYEIETWTRAEVFVDDNNNLILPQISTGHRGIDTIIRNAWLGHYDSTAQMLAHAESFQDITIRDSRRPIEYPVSDDDLCKRVQRWREVRLEQYGYILKNLPSETEVQECEEHCAQYQQELSFFKNYKMPIKD